MTRTCSFAGCDGDPEHKHEHVPTGKVERYCSDHAPDADGETWRVP